MVRIIHYILFLTLIPICAAQGQTAKPIRMIVPFTAGGPADIAARIVAQKLRDVRNRIIELGGEPVGGSPAEFDAFQKSEMARWAKVVKESGAKVE